MDGGTKVALVTGVSRGIGKKIAEALVQEGFSVVGTSRNPMEIREEDRIPGVNYLPLDLYSTESIDKLVKNLSRIDVLINNAGESQIGPIEEVPLEKIRQLFQLNFFGEVQLIQNVLPLMRRNGGGTIINITSLASHTSVPFSAVYASCKSALETLTRGLRNEVRKYGIKVVAVAPAFINTNIRQEKICSDNSGYNPEFNRVKAIRDNQISNGTDPAEVAYRVVKILKKKNPGPFYPAGKNAVLIAFLYKLAPGKLAEKLIRRHFKIG